MAGSKVSGGTMKSQDNINKGKNNSVVEISDSISIGYSDVRRIELGEQGYKEKANISKCLNPSDSVGLKPKANDTGSRKRKINRGDDADVWSDIAMVKNDYGALQLKVDKMANELSKLTSACVRISRAVNEYHSLSVGDTVAEVLRQLKPHLTDMAGHQNMVTGKSPVAARSIQAESPAINDVKSSQAQSGDPWVKYLYTNGTNKKHPEQQMVNGVWTVLKQPNQQTQVSDCSVSPTLPPKPAHQSIKEKMRRRLLKCPRKHKRSLVRKRANNISSKTRQGRRMNNEGMTLRVGPFNVKHDMSPEDIELLEFVFMERPLTEQEASYDRVVVAGNEAVHLKRYDMLSLGPGQHVCSLVINVCAELLNTPESAYWYLPTYFGESATNGNHMNGINQWVQHTRTLSRLNRFAGRLRGCSRIFIPMHEEALVNHWWLLVVNLIDQTGEIFDSAPNPRMSPRREADARKVLHMMDILWFTEDVLAMEVPVCFRSFRCAPAVSNQVQPNDYDCGVFVIRNMQMYGRNWANEYISDQQRASLALECMWHPSNAFHPLDTTVAECLDQRRECRVQRCFENLSESNIEDKYGGRGKRVGNGNGAFGGNKIGAVGGLNG